VELQIDRKDLRPCGIVTESVPSLPASLRITINQAAEFDIQRTVHRGIFL